MDPDEADDRQAAADYHAEEMEYDYGERARDPHFDERFPNRDLNR